MHADTHENFEFEESPNEAKQQRETNRAEPQQPHGRQQKSRSGDLEVIQQKIRANGRNAHTHTRQGTEKCRGDENLNETQETKQEFENFTNTECDYAAAPMNIQQLLVVEQLNKEFW